MFQDMMSQLGTLSSVFAKSKDKPPSAAIKEAGRSEADDVSDGEASDPSEETDKGRKLIFEVSEPTQAFSQLAFCRARPTDNKTRRTWVERFSLPEGNETRCPKLDSILKNELPKDAVELDRKLSHLQNFVLDAAGPGGSDRRADGIREARPGGSVIGNTAGLDVPRECIGPILT